ncbi:GAF domain-containing protein [Marinobacter sp.]|uniref:GAF domain-containing protein n=1 Tax=Marinobacter sp. TaxID=50741 RepID=UPI00356A1942
MKIPEHPANEAQRLSALEASQLLDTPPEDRFDRITRLAARLFDVPICLISLVDKDRQWFKSRYGLGVRETARDISFCGHAILGAEPFVVENALDNEDFADNPLVTGEPNIRFYAGAPLADRHGNRLGTLCLMDKTSRDFSSDDLQSLRDLADIVEREFAYQKVGTYYAERSQALNILNDISLDSGGSVQDRVERALAVANTYLGMDTAVVSSITGDAYTILWHHERHPASSLKNGLTLPLEQTYCSILIPRGEALAIDHMAHSRYSELPCYLRFRFESYLAAPIWVDGEIIGSLSFSSATPRRPGFTETEKTFVSLLARWVADIILHRDQADTLDKLVANAPGMLYQYRLWPDGHATFPYSSIGVQSIYNVTAEQVRQDANSAIQRIHPDDLAAVVKSIQHSADTLTPWVSKYRVLWQDKSWRWVEGKANPEKLPDNSILWHGYIVDIDERHKNEEIKNQFISTVSHELRTPLTSIAGSLGLILGGATGELPEKTRSLLAIAHRNTSHLRSLIDDLLDIEKLISGKVAIKLVRQPVADIVTTAIEDIRAYADQKQVQLRQIESSSELLANVDPQRLQQALTNLLSNAVKFSPPHKDVTINIRKAGGQVLIEVSDQGPGVPESFRVHIFKKFAQADSSSARQKEGTGLGLAITQQIMHTMDGHVGYDSEEGKGATFWLSLPIATAK